VKLALTCADDDCQCGHLIVEEIEVNGTEFLLRVRCNFCGAIIAYNLWTIWEAQGGDA